MINYVDEVLAGAEKFKLTYNDNTTATGVKIELETGVTTPGTPLNKTFFDSIQSDLTTLNSNKLNVSAKATTSQAQAGSDDTNYMTASKVRQFTQYLTKAKTLTSTTSTTAQSFTLFDASAIATDIGSTNAGLVKKIIITGSATGGSPSNPTKIDVGGTGWKTFEMENGTTSTSQNAPTQYQNKESFAIPFKYEIDLV